MRGTPDCVDVLSEADKDRAVSTLILAFSADPGARWFSPESELYISNMRGYAGAVCDLALTHDTALATDGCAGIALGLPPDVEIDDSIIGDVLTPGIPPAEMEDMALMAARSEALRPSAPHWYLPIIGVDPAYHGQGRGDLLMQSLCRWVDRDGTPAYLESSNPRNVPLYKRHGFEVLEVIQGKASPPIISMIRPAPEG